MLLFQTGDDRLKPRLLAPRSNKPHHSPPGVQGSAGGWYGAAKRERLVSIRTRSPWRGSFARVRGCICGVSHIESHGALTPRASACAIAPRAAVAPRAA